jgi:anti-anti-sigma regulatory factor
MNSTGFQSLLSSHKLLSGPGEELRLFGLTDSVQQKIARYNTLEVFHIFETESDAMKDLTVNDE